LNEQVKRNRSRFPEVFAFQLTAEEKAELVAKCDQLKKLKYSKSLPYAFSEHGAIMADGVLNSDRDVEVSVFIVRAFVRLHRVISEHKELAEKIAQLESHIADHDETINILIQAIEQLMNPALPAEKRRIGFRSAML
jgi:hypothetical protein